MSGRISTPEKQELALALQDPQQSDAIREQLFRLLEDSTEDIEVEDARWDNQILAVLQSDKPAAPVRPLYKRYWWAAAAAIVIIIGGSLWRWQMPHPQNNVAAITNPADILPGGNRATLTIAGGKTIVLDSAANGTIAQQGNVRVVKLANGMLAYTVDGKPLESWTNTMSTPIGGQYRLTLPDGTQVWLNAASSITYPSAFTGSERKVSITGEAYFEVAQDPKRPFKVNVNNEAELLVLGTHFNINTYTDEPAALSTLLEGSVSITAPGITGTEHVVLRPGQQAVTQHDDSAVNGKKRIRLVNGVDTDQITAWKNGRFNFNGTGLHSVMRQLSRWYGITVRYDGNVPDETFEGELTRDLNLAQVLRILEKMDIRFRVEGRTLIVLP